LNPLAQHLDLGAQSLLLGFDLDKQRSDALRDAALSGALTQTLLRRWASVVKQRDKRLGKPLSRCGVVTVERRRKALVLAQAPQKQAGGSTSPRILASGSA
jgi:hypothetical protein